MKAGFVEKLIGRLGKIGPEEVQNYFLRLAQEKGFLETVFNSIQEGIIVTDSKGRITYLNDAACQLFGLERKTRSENVWTRAFAGWIGTLSRAKARSAAIWRSSFPRTDSSIFTASLS